MTEAEQERMRALCTAIVQEQDSSRMMALVEELNELLAVKQERLDGREQMPVSKAELKAETK